MKTVMITSFNKMAVRLTTTKMDRTHRTRRWRVNAVATPVPRFNPVWLFLLGVCAGYCLCASIACWSQGSSLWLWSTVICWHECGTNGLSHRCLPYQQRWIHWASVNYVKKLGEFISVSV
jgi:hypothetical protein